MSECERIQRKASIHLELEGCREHGEFAVSSATIEIGGVPPFVAMDGFLACVEETISVAISQMPEVKDYLSKPRDWGRLWDTFDEDLSGTGSAPLAERAQKWLSVHLAHQLMLSRVASRGYETSRRTSAFMSFPMD